MFYVSTCYMWAVRMGEGLLTELSSSPLVFFTFYRMQVWCMTPISGWPADTQDPHPLHEDNYIFACLYDLKLELKARLCITWGINILEIDMTVYVYYVLMNGTWYVITLCRASVLAWQYVSNVIVQCRMTCLASAHVCYWKKNIEIITDSG